MKREALRRRVRLLAQDTARPYLWQDEDIDDWLNEAQQEAAVRARLLRAVPAANPDLCEHGLSAGEAVVTIPTSLFEISSQSWRQGDRTTRLHLVSREWMDTTRPGWRDESAGEPAYLVQDANVLQIVPAPSVAGTLLLEGYRLPKAIESDEDEPEIPAFHHVHLVQWALHIGYSLPDAETFNPDKSRIAEAEFSRFFGSRPDADLRASTRHDETHRIVAWL
ncbi:DUF6682 family protein [Thauera humireducens]|uniref:Uncharacterized protein n=1 Tax=Thauera humireducens TaxID=1134435 RepID=A0A127K382_9RHOO|nr:DUF6682 family protein [Thauera humireducens]AMO36416.1 hypothetical protein AC731_005380 [Thauera humireducens]